MKYSKTRLIAAVSLFGILIAALFIFQYIDSSSKENSNPIDPTPVPTFIPIKPSGTPPPPTVQKKPGPNLRNKLLSLLNPTAKKNDPLEIPSPPENLNHPTTKPIPVPPNPTNPRAIGRQKRAKLPLGVVLRNDVSVFSDVKKTAILYRAMTGDFVRVFKDETNLEFVKVQPGVDLYLAATSKQFEAAGDRFLDAPGWIEKKHLQIFSPPQAVEFTQKTTPMTLGNDSNFSTLSFYERAMKNPDPVVHRVVGPRLIELLLGHEDYGNTWGTLLRDGDSKIRSVTLAALSKRGISESREIIEDLISRLAEITKEPARGETEAEVLAILSALKESGHPRVPTALQSFWGGWANNQNQAILDALAEISPRQKIQEKPKKKKKKKKD